MKAGVFLDPPYNTGADGFAYKDGYRRSSWLTALSQTVGSLRGNLSRDGTLWMTLDDNEQARGVELLGQLFGHENLVGVVAWQKKVSPANDSQWFSGDHDYVTVFSLDKTIYNLPRLPRTGEQAAYYTNPDNDPRGPWNSAAYTCAKSADERPNLYYPITQPNTGEEIWPRRERVWACERATHEENVANGLVYWGVDGRARMPRKKTFLKAGGVVPRSVWQYGDTGHTQEATTELSDLMGTVPFRSPKAKRLLMRVAQLACWPEGTLLDLYAGSGTTGHAVLNLNREDNGSRKFILVEVNDYFDTVLLPRILKATYSKSWKDGKPVDRTPVPGGALYKVLYLESYEDTLANITLPPAPSDNPIPFHLQRDYTIRYMLDHETRQAVLDLDRFRKPFGWTMEVRRGGLVTKDHPVDLVETFNYLIGLHVSRYGYFRDADRIRYVEGTVKEDGNDRRVLVLWRDCDLVPDDELVRLFDDREFAPVSSREYDRIYVNGDPPLANLKRPDEQWKVLAIEDEFKRLSFADDEA